MATNATFCHNCGAQLPPGAAFCSRCGMPVAEPKPAASPPQRGARLSRRTRMLLLGGLVLLFIYAGVSQRTVGGDRTGSTHPVASTVAQGTLRPTDAGASVNGSTTIPTALPTPTAAPAPTPLPKVGQDVQVGDVRWKILSVHDVGNVIRSTNQFVANAKTSGRFIEVRLEVENVGKDQLHYDGIDLKDDKDRKFTSLADEFALVPESENCHNSVNLNPNLPRTCRLIFEVPADAKGLKARVGPLKLLTWAADEEIDLGL